MKVKADQKIKTKKKTYQGQGKRTKYGHPGPYGNGKKYKKPYRGQGKRR